MSTIASIKRLSTPEAPKETRSGKAYTRDEMRVIVDAFKSDRFKPAKSAFKDSYYAPFIEWLSFSGMRPSEAVALKWSDVNYTGSKPTSITVNKAWRNQVEQGTKTGKERDFPLNSQVVELLSKIPRIENLGGLIFPSLRGGHINIKDFSKRYFQRVGKGLESVGAIAEYLPLYNLRHSFITQMLGQGLEAVKVARACGTSVRMIESTYYGKEQIELPTI